MEEEYTVNLAEISGEKFYRNRLKGARLWRGAKTALENNMKHVGFLRIQIENIASFFGPDEIDEIWITFLIRIFVKVTITKTPPRHDSFLCTDNFWNPEDLSTFSNRQPLSLRLPHSMWSWTNLKIEVQTDHLYQSEYADDVLSIKTTLEKIWLKEGLNICYLKFSL